MSASWLIFLAFTVLLGLTMLSPATSHIFRLKSRADWLLDLTGLWIQGLAIPTLQVTLLAQGYYWLWPEARASLQLPGMLAFLLSFVVVDYLYYWNHRLLHTRWLWPLHLVHHTVTHRDVLGTSRNSVWSSFAILYLWVHGLWLYLLQEPQAYLLGMSLTAALDLWRHSQIQPQPGSQLERFLSSWLILPQHHACHHQTDLSDRNYGANFNWWDRLHGTYAFLSTPVDGLGIQTSLSLARQLLWPFR